MRFSLTARAALGLAAAALGLAACQLPAGELPEVGGASVVATDATALTLALASDIPAPDPDTAYNGYEMTLVNSAYEGLVGYATGTDEPTIAPELATDWSVSDDGLTYTFHLREGVTFHDGTEFTSAAVEPSFARRLDIGAAGPGYMVAGVTDIATPSDHEVVLTLDAPNDSFLDYLASPFGPKMVSPVALAEHAGTAGLDWFSTHDAGTGPYEYTDFASGSSYSLIAYDDYWEPAPAYDLVTFRVIESATTIQLQLETGDLDGIVGGMTKEVLASLGDSDEVSTYLFPSMTAALMFLNPASDLFTAQEERTAFLSGIDRDALAAAALGPIAADADGPYPSLMVDAATNVDAVEYDPHGLDAFEGEHVRIGYPAFLPGAQDLADHLTATLNAAGIPTESVGLESGVFWAMSPEDEDAPDITLFTNWPDAAHPDTWARIFYTPAGGLDLFGAEVEGLEGELDAILADGDRSRYADIAAQVSGSGYWTTLANLDTPALFRTEVTGVEEARNPVLGIDLDLSQLAPAS
ncbi:ABC transporter substrate-binding protein [Demequina sp. NBRC 110057]|uniref:ABC transporter substrate-binding protein n=1 Tax=Demequina sp. NBRC 110057 TaxID=1570346 RepID=UPI000A05DBFD|nr:ABC transporter substrate-binding protein [Demequina sp. NBRC 110057]